MVVRKTKKSRKARGYNRRRGNGKRVRGAGNRGGRGRAGLGKRAGHRKWKFIKEEGMDYLGIRGFVSTKQKKNFHPNTINTNQLDQKINYFVENKIAVKTPAGFEIDLAKAGFRKLLGKGKVINKIIVKVEKTTNTAKEKIEAAGGKVISEIEPKEEFEAIEEIEK